MIRYKDKFLNSRACKELAAALGISVYTLGVIVSVYYYYVSSVLYDLSSYTTTKFIGFGQRSIQVVNTGKIISDFSQILIDNPKQSMMCILTLGYEFQSDIEMEEFEFDKIKEIANKYGRGISSSYDTYYDQISKTIQENWSNKENIQMIKEKLYIPNFVIPKKLNQFFMISDRKELPLDVYRPLIGPEINAPESFCAAELQRSSVLPLVQTISENIRDEIFKGTKYKIKEIEDVDDLLMYIEKRKEVEKSLESNKILDIKSIKQSAKQLVNNFYNQALSVKENIGYAGDIIGYGIDKIKIKTGLKYTPEEKCKVIKNNIDIMTDYYYNQISDNIAREFELTTSLVSTKFQQSRLEIEQSNNLFFLFLVFWIIVSSIFFKCRRTLVDACKRERDTGKLSRKKNSKKYKNKKSRSKTRRSRSTRRRSRSKTRRSRSTRRGSRSTRRRSRSTRRGSRSTRRCSKNVKGKKSLPSKKEVKELEDFLTMLRKQTNYV